MLTWAKLATKFKLAYDINSLAVVEVSGDSRDADPRFMVGTLLENLYTINKLIPDLKLYISYWYKIQTVIALRSSHGLIARKCSLKAFLFNPYSIKSIYLLIAAYVLNENYIKVDKFIRSVIIKINRFYK